MIKTQTSYGLTLPRLLMVSLWFACGAIFGLAFERHWGHPGLYLGWIVGTLSGMAVTWALLLTRLLFLFPLPPCKQGRCTRIGKDYVWKRGRILGYEGNGVYLYKCNCGDQYLRQGKKFLELLPDGTSRPFKRLVGFRKWGDDRVLADQP